MDHAAVANRARDLLAQMTMDEKCGQLQQYFCFGEAAHQSERYAAEARKMEVALATGTVGSLLFVAKAADTNRLQRQHLEASRLKIPLLFGFDVIHGLRTIFPVPIALAASWDMEMITACQQVAAREARAVGIHWTFAPMVDISRDPRWGRIVEGAGEDAFLGAAVAVAQVCGFQGATLAGEHVISGPKHFAGYGASLGGRDYDEVNLSEYELRNVYLPPFQAAVEAGAGNIMTAYMPLNGVPATGNKRLLTKILRDEWQFEGFVVSDANAAINLVTHGYSQDPVSAAAAALNAGLDMEMSTGTAAYTNLSEARAAGLVDQDQIDRAVLRVLEAKIRLGLFEHPFVDEIEAERVLASPQHRDLACRAATRGAVLLKNLDGLLPLTADLVRIAVIGPLADSARDTLGPWVFEQDLSETVTVRAGLEAGAPEGVAISYEPGVRMPERHHAWPFGAMHETDDRQRWNDFDEEAGLIRAVALARSSDVVILTLGERYDMSGEIASRATLDLPGRQLDLLKAVSATGTPLVLLVMSGRPLDLRWADENVPAILQIWYPGTRGGEAVADLLFGRESPAGRLPFSWPRSVGQVPLPYTHTRSHMPDKQGTRYWEEDSTPLYAFGYGLSYTSFSYSDLRAEVSMEGGLPRIDVSVTVSNIGDRQADEVAQLYVHQRHGSSARPVRELKGFQRVTLEGGGRQELTFVLGSRELQHWSDAAGDWVLDRGPFDLWVGSDSQAQLGTTAWVE